MKLIYDLSFIFVILFSTCILFPQCIQFSLIRDFIVQFSIFIFQISNRKRYRDKITFSRGTFFFFKSKQHIYTFIERSTIFYRFNKLIPSRKKKILNERIGFKVEGIKTFTDSDSFGRIFERYPLTFRVKEQNDWRMMYTVVVRKWSIRV